MVGPAIAAGFAALCSGIIALEVFSFLDLQKRGAHDSSPAQATLLDSALDLLLPLGAAGVLFTAVAFICHHLSRHAAAGEAGNRRLSELVIFVLCVSAGVLDFCCFVHQPAGGVDDRSARARAIGLAAHRALPTAAAATFFSGMILIIIAHVRVDGEGGGGAVVGAGHRANQGSVLILTKITLGEAAGLVLLVTLALCVKY